MRKHAVSIMAGAVEEETHQGLNKTNSKTMKDMNQTTS
jgi:hypothetical protein